MNDSSSACSFFVSIFASTQSPKELFAGPDWSRARDIDGKETVVNRPLAFPLTTGKAWEVRYTEQHPNKMFRSEEWLSKYAVVGFESVEVPAGKFTALKIEAEGRWTAELEPTQTVVQGAQSNADGTSMVTQTQKTMAGRCPAVRIRLFGTCPKSGAG